MALVRLEGGGGRGERRMNITTPYRLGACQRLSWAARHWGGWVALVLKTRSRIYPLLLLLIQLMPARQLAVAVVVILIPFHYLGSQKKKKRTNGANLIKS